MTTHKYTLSEALAAEYPYYVNGFLDAEKKRQQAVQELAHAAKWCAERMSYGDSPEAAAEAYIEMFAVRSQE